MPAARRLLLAKFNPQIGINRPVGSAVGTAHILLSYTCIWTLQNIQLHAPRFRHPHSELRIKCILVISYTNIISKEMPELPEVNTVKKTFHTTVLDLDIIRVSVYDEVILRNRSASQFKQALEGRRFVDTYRQGKYFFGILDNGLHILFHLGMTGDLVYYFSEDDQPRYERFCMQFSDGLILGYNDPRKFSNIRVIEDLPLYLQEIKLGPDALVISQDAFETIFNNRKTSLKAVLMNQQLIAGIGNLYADEICYQAKIHPASSAGALSSNHLNVLYQRMRHILLEACDREAYYQIYPDDWFWQLRSDENRVLKGKGTVRKLKIGGRTTYFVDGYQKLIE